MAISVDEMYGAKAATAPPAKAPPAAPATKAPAERVSVQDMFAAAAPKPKAKEGDSVPMAFAKGMGSATTRLEETFNLALGTVPMLMDAVEGLAKGKTITDRQDAYFRQMIDPVIAQQKALELDPKTKLPARIANTVGDTLEFIAQAILTGPEAAPSVTAARTTAGVLEPAAVRTGRQAAAAAARQGVGMAQVPAVAEAVDTGRQVLERTGDRTAALRAAQKKYLTTVAVATAPMAAPGKLATRVATGAAVGTAQMEAGRVSMNQSLPADMQQPFTWEGLAGEALMGAVFGAMAGGDPYASARALRDMGPEKFDEVVTKNPRTAAKLIKEAAKTDPKVADAALKRAKKVSRMGIDELKDLGEQAAKSKAKREAGPLPEKWEFADEGKETPKAEGTPAEPPATRREDMSESDLMLRDLASRKSTYAQRSTIRSDLPLASSKVPYDLDAAHASAWPVYSAARDWMVKKGFDRNEKHVVDNSRPQANLSEFVLEVAKGKGLYSDVLRLIAPFIPKEAGIQFVNPAHKILDGAYAHYDPSSGHVRVGIDTNRVSDSFLTQSIIHEASHAALYDFMVHNPKHPYVTEMRGLMAEAKLRARRMQKAIPPGKSGLWALDRKGVNLYNRLYGMKNPHEFVAEIMSDPQFQRFIINSEKFASPLWKGKRMMSSFGEIVRKIFRVPKEVPTALLNDILGLTKDTMQVAALRREMGERGETVPTVETIKGKDGEMSVVDDLTTQRLEKYLERDKARYAENKKDALDAIERGRKVYGVSEIDSTPVRITAEAEVQKADHLIIEETRGQRAERGRQREAEATRALESILTPDQAAAGLRDSIRDMEQSAKEKAANKWGVDPIIYESGGMPFTKGDVKKMTELGLKYTRKIPGFSVAEGKLKGWLEQAIDAFVPEAKGPRAKLAAAVVSKAIAKWKSANAQLVGMSEARREFWNNFHENSSEFMNKFETGEPFTGHYAEQFENFRQAYKGLMAWLSEEDKRLGIKYKDVDNYISHIFERPDEVGAYMQGKYGRKFGDPYFTKDRIGKTIQELQDAGYKLKYTNPEDIMMARVKASNIAHAKIEMLREMEKVGLAVRKGKGVKVPPTWSKDVWRSPTGELYYLNGEAKGILDKAFKSKSLWNDKTALGDVYRAGMWVKNKMVPLRLFGFFHAAHIGLLINNAAALVRSAKILLTGNLPKNPKMFMKELTSGLTPLSGMWDRSANRVLQAYWGRVSEGELTQGERQVLADMQEGGFVPGMAEQDRAGSMQNFRTAMQMHKYGSAAFKLPFAMIDALQYPMFHVWIPTLKIAAYTRDVATARLVKPEINDDPVMRMQEFARIRKSVDNRFGEMNYDTLFWNRWMKDLAVLNTLSLGWQWGFIREYGGGATEILKAPAHALERGGLENAIREGQMDRALFSSFYLAGAMGLSGLMSYALTGQKPEWLDYFYPRTGEMGADGKPKRVNTPFFSREFASIYTHMQNEGVAEGLTRLVKNKASGVIAMTEETFLGVNSLDQEIRDPNAPAYKQLEQTLAAVYRDVMPISWMGIKESGSVAGKVLSTAGFSPAPKYATETPVEGAISASYQKYLGQKKVPFEQAEFSREKRELKKLYDKESPEYQTKLDAMVEKHQMSAGDVRRLENQIRSTGSAYLSMFKRLSWQEQKRILDKHWKEMSEDEREEYLKVANREHLRYSYEGPEQ